MRNGTSMLIATQSSFFNEILLIYKILLAVDCSAFSKFKTIHEGKRKKTIIKRSNIKGGKCNGRDGRQRGLSSRQRLRGHELAALFLARPREAKIMGVDDTFTIPAFPSAEAACLRLDRMPPRRTLRGAR